jgi:hypothetical protein
MMISIAKFAERILRKYMDCEDSYTIGIMKMQKRIERLEKLIDNP